MKAKYFIIYVAAAIAFAAVCVWLFLSGGRSARAIRAKFRLGGILLTVGSILSFSSCSGPGIFVTCYDVAVANEIHVDMPSQTSTAVKSGEAIGIVILGPTYDKYTYKIKDVDGSTVLQSGSLVLDNESSGSIKIGITGYKGTAKVIIYGLRESKDFEIYDFSIELQ